jgi:uroporphyrinogen decarboxylase
MTPKQNALEIIRFGRPQQVVRGAPTHSIAYRGCNHEGYEGGGHRLPVGSKWTDIWGTGWEREHEGVMGFPKSYPLAEITKALKSFKPPDPQDRRIYAQIYEEISGWDPNESFLCGRHRDTLWEKSYMLAGMENIMCFFYAEPESVKKVLRMIMDFQLGIAEHYLDLGVEMVSMGDDLGTQNGLLLSPAIIREFLVPEYRRLFDLYKSRGVLVEFHSCGHIEPALDTFMELGVNILNPVQASANDLNNVRSVTEGKMALAGAVSTGTVMDGPPEKIRDEVKTRIRQLGSNGGYFCRPDQGLPFPEEHIAAMDQAIEEFGRYPVS